MTTHKAGNTPIARNGAHNAASATRGSAAQPPVKAPSPMPAVISRHRRSSDVTRWRVSPLGVARIISQEASAVKMPAFSSPRATPAMAGIPTPSAAVTASRGW